MKRMAVPILAMLVLAAPAAASGADKTHQQLMAEIRMLQEQQQQLQQMLGGLADTLKTMTAKMDEQTGASRKSFADQKLLIDNIGEGVRILREKADDTNVRLSSMTQELETLRQTIASQPQAGVAPPGGEPSGDPSAPPLVSTGGQSVPGVPSGPPPSVSPQRMYDAAFADYAAGQYDLAVVGFETYIKMFPRFDKADDAQLNIGNSLFGASKFREAVAAYQKVVSDYPQSDSVPPAYYKMGLSYERLGQIDLARRALETMIKSYPDSQDTILARQVLERLNRPR